MSRRGVRSIRRRYARSWIWKAAVARKCIAKQKLEDILSATDNFNVTKPYLLSYNKARSEEKSTGSQSKQADDALADADKPIKNSNVEAEKKKDNEPMKQYTLFYNPGKVRCDVPQNPSLNPADCAKLRALKSVTNHLDAMNEAATYAAVAKEPSLWTESR